MIESARIRIYPSNPEQMESAIASAEDDDLKKAYCEMLQACMAHPDQWEWYAMWMIEKKDGTPIGNLCFKGLDDKNPEIGYGINEAFQGQGYATEAVNLAVKWAFEHPEISAVEAETDPDNIASQKVLKKCNFKANGEIGEEGPRFIVCKEENSHVLG